MEIFAQICTPTHLHLHTIALVVGNGHNIFWTAKNLNTQPINYQNSSTPSTFNMHTLNDDVKTVFLRMHFKFNVSEDLHFSYHLL